jgi:hypothetical protein
MPQSCTLPVLTKNIMKSELSYSDLYDLTALDIDVGLYPFTIFDVIRRIENGSINLYPEFQRNLEWTIKEKSRLIESLLVRFPLPIFYFNEREDYTLDVIDGLHRLNAFHDFIKNKYTLKELEYLTQFERYSFRELPATFQRRIEEATISVYKIRAGTPQNVIRSLFLRLNTTGKLLNTNEIRHIIHLGRTTDFLQKCVQLDSFQQIIQIPDRRLLHEELVLRFISFHLLDIKKLHHGFQNFLDMGIQMLQHLVEKADDTCGVILKKFDRTLKTLFHLFGEHAFNKYIFEGNPPQKYVFSKLLFEIWTVNLAEMNDKQHATLLKKKDTIINIYQKKLTADQKFRESLKTSARSSAIRFSIIKKILQEVL